MSEMVDLRCPLGPRSLLARLAPVEKPHITDGNLVELACSDCARTLRKQGKDVLRVLHRYDLAGSLVESVAVPRS